MSLLVENLSFAYGNRQILDSISFFVEKGDVFCLLGPNGTGKTTLLKCILGIYSPENGRVQVDGCEVIEQDVKELAKKMAYVPQAASLVFSYKVLDLVVMGRTPFLSSFSSPGQEDYRMAREALERLEISHLSYRLYSQLSGGEQQLVLIARALTQQTKVLVMDEPTASLDYGNQNRILEVIRQLAQQGYSIVMTTHFPHHVFLAGTKVGLLKGGKLLALGSPEQVVSSERLSELYNANIQVVSVNLPTKEESVKVCVPLLRNGE